MKGVSEKDLARCRAALAAARAGGVADGKTGPEPRPPKVVELKGAARARAVAAGEKELRAGRVAVLLVAGGQGSRLGFDGPKGAYPIGPLTDAPLFFFHARKVLALGLKYGRSVPFYIMTSEANRKATEAHFREHRYFGLPKKDVIFFTQGMWPALNDDGSLFMDRPGHVFMSPDGHGGVLSALKTSGCLADMKKRGVKSVFFFQVDNPIVEIADPAFIGLHVLEKGEYSLKVCAKRSPDEGMGVPARVGSHFAMIEYTELTPDMRNRRAKNGELYFKYGSPAIHVFDRAFLEKEAAKDMPLHLAHKKIPFMKGGKVVKPDAPNGWKFEKFVFDALADAKRVVCMAFDRADEFSPVKNAEGDDSPATCRADMMSKWRRLLASHGVLVDLSAPLEIDPAGF